MDQKIDIILIILSIVISVSIVLTYVVYRLEKTVYEEIEQYKKDNTEKVKQSLKNCVDIVYSLINYHQPFPDIEKERLRKETYVKNLREKYKRRLKNVIDVAESILNLKLEQSTEEIKKAQDLAIGAIKQIKYDGGAGYVWITDTNPVPKMIMHPKEPKLDGEELNDNRFNVVKGKNSNVFVEIVELLQENNDGFVETETNDDDLLHEISYVRKIAGWNWIIGTGVNLEDPDKDKSAEAKNIIRNLTYDDGTGYFWATNNDESSPQLLVYPLDPSREKKMLGGKYVKHGALVQSFIDVVKPQLKSCDNFDNSAKQLNLERGFLDKLVDDYTKYAATLIQSLIDAVKPQSNLDDADVPPICRGYLEYRWDKPTSQGTIRDVRKLAYVRLYEEPLNMIIGTGVYMDDVDKTTAIGRIDIFEKINVFEIKIVIGAILIIFFIGALNYFLNYFYFQYLRQSFNSLFSKISYQRNLFRGSFLKKSFKR
jgi:methyl-accepting chemotaxis protein